MLEDSAVDMDRSTRRLRLAEDDDTGTELVLDKAGWMWSLESEGEVRLVDEREAYRFARDHGAEPQDIQYAFGVLAGDPDDDWTESVSITHVAAGRLDRLAARAGMTRDDLLDELFGFPSPQGLADGMAGA